jgi:hypothetical protein
MNTSSDRNEDQPDLGRRRFVHQAGAGALATGAAGKSLALLLSGSVIASKNKATIRSLESVVEFQLGQITA